MKDKNYSWHKEIYDKAVKQMASFAAGLFPSSEIEELDRPEGWLGFFEEGYPEQYGKYENALSQITALWGNKDPNSMEAFKKAVKVEVDATKWVLQKFKTHKEEGRRAEEMKGKQEVLV